MHTYNKNTNFVTCYSSWLTMGVCLYNSANVRIPLAKLHDQSSDNHIHRHFLPY